MNRNTTKVMAMLVLAAVVLTLAGCGPRGMVRVNGDKISKDEFFARLERVPVQTPTGTEPAGQYVIEQIIREKLVQQLAKDKGVAPTEAQISSKTESVKRSAGGNLNKALAMRGMTLEDLKEQLALQQSFINLYTRSVKVPDSAVKSEYDKALNMKNSPLKRPEQILVSAIVADSKAKMDKAYAMLKGGQEFGSVAMTMSVIPGAKDSQGRLDWFSRNDKRLPPNALAAVFALPLGNYTSPMQFGKQFVVLRADQKRPTKVTSYDEAKNDLRERMALMKASKNNSFNKEMQAFAKKSDIVVNAQRYKNIPEMLKKQMAMPMQPGQQPGQPGAQPTVGPQAGAQKP